jgi:corrinoid protein of di/trimethylamine methyltransferase
MTDMSQQEFDNDVIREIYEGMVEIDVDKTPELVRSALAGGQDVLKIVDALSKGIKVVGDKFEALECFLPELIMAARIMEKSMDILKPSLQKLDIKVGSTGTIVMANVQGDIHDIGRQIVVAMLRVAGFDVHDLGHDVKADSIIDKAVELNADVIGLSSLLTTSLPYARQVLELLKVRNLRDRFKVAMGGGAVTPEYSEQIGADGYSRDAASAINLMQQLVAGR